MKPETAEQLVEEMDLEVMVVIMEEELAKKHRQLQPLPLIMVPLKQNKPIQTLLHLLHQLHQQLAYNYHPCAIAYRDFFLCIRKDDIV